MALVYTEEQEMLRDTAKEFLSEHCGPSTFRKLREQGPAHGYDPETWSQMAELGWPGIIIGEDHDGLDFGYVGAGVLFEEMGRSLACAPLFATAIVSADLIGRAGNESQKTTYLAGIAAGEHLVAPAIDEGPRHNPAMTATRAVPGEGTYTLEGRKAFVLEGRSAETLLVLARTAGEAGDREGLSLFVVPRETAGVTVTANQMVDFRAADEVVLSSVIVPESALLGPKDEALPLLEASLDRANCLLAAELLGLAEEAFSRTIAYMRERKQFGVPIGSFQALQHRAAHLLCEIELTRSAVLKALQAAESDAAMLPLLASLAKAKAAKTAEAVTNESIQMHGGIGMTDEYDIGFFIKRARVVQMTYGDRLFHADRVATIKGY